MIILHGGYSNLTSTFFSPLTNQRAIETAEQISAEGKANVVAIVRNLQADSGLINKARRSCTSEIRPYLHRLDCVTLPNVGHSVRCAVNPTLGNPGAGNPLPQHSQSRGRQAHVVVGSGPTEMMAVQACGHTVTLCGNEDHLDSCPLEISALYSKYYHHRYLQWDID